MTQEQINYLDSSVNTQFRVLRLVKMQYHKNKWTDQFIQLVNEMRDKTIWDLENLFLLPEYTFNPLTRNLKDEDEPMRVEIYKEVSKRFKDFRQEQNIDEE